ncbi:SPOR domain-containing protein [Microbacterium aquimaris]|uniref:SPOR domain-containing protein n=1 Tax=Microbacterium aquimaris TaxID=459816 RepID=A0ABU5N8C7_9MICO|nr:SPOR domain-containing protein [Microbacterium aquimaris]MAP62467.1 hypothetical protein [Microbacterium sp.]MDZ8162302.1 SPOR domain-containing protein [Microbacterium aquimaris]MDZ8275969.1 SPOR domain-containing protein [Microbacterium aquimaris]|tara:strand:- start:187 stop:405 length:219 start_codon:yes stop_codon:yes gene_type:complete
MSGSEEKFWYNLSTGQVEKGHVSPAIDRAGPFDTAEEAARAPELLKERSRAWADDDARDDGWGVGGSASDDK